MGNVINIRQTEIDSVEKALNDARDNDFESVFIVGVKEDSLLILSSKVKEVSMKIGFLEIIKHEIITKG